jgi:hypothetical protein
MTKDDRAFVLHRENVLLGAVRSACAATNLKIEIPEVLPNRNGTDLFTYRERVCRVTKHIEGVRPYDERLETYRGSASILRDLHRLLRDIPIDLAVSAPLLADVSPMLERTLGHPWEPATDDAEERPLVFKTAEWLRPRLADIEAAPCQLLHGDWSTPNLLVDRPEGGAFVGVLDWQFCSTGPVVTDIAQAVSGALMWSSLPVERVVEVVFDAYGGNAERGLLGTAMVAYWFRNYWWIRDELERDERLRPAMNRQPARLRSVMNCARSIDH